MQDKDHTLNSISGRDWKSFQNPDVQPGRWTTTAERNGSLYLLVSRLDHRRRAKWLSSPLVLRLD